MAKAATFTSILDTPVSEIERPKAMPVGEYIWLVKGQPKFDKTTKKQTEYVEFTLQCMEALETVDSDQLEEWLGKRKLQDTTQRITYYLTENALWRLKDFISHCGVDTDSDETLKQLIDACIGCQVIGTIKHTPSDDGTAVYGNITSTAPVE